MFGWLEKRKEEERERERKEKGQLDVSFLQISRSSFLPNHELDLNKNTCEWRLTFPLPSYETRCLFSRHLYPPTVTQVDAKIVRVKQLSFGYNEPNASSHVEGQLRWFISSSV